MECPKCGHINPDTAMNCEKCRINLEWAREHGEELDKRQRLEKRRRMEEQKRRKPATPVVFFVAVVGIVFLMACPLGSILISSPKPSVSELGATLMIFGWPFMIVGIPMVVLSLRPLGYYPVFRRSSTTAQATLLRRHTETDRYWDEYGGGTTTHYHVTVQFDVARSGAPAEQMTLKAKVSKKLYDRLGPEATVRYATEDPCVALLEGEAGF